jgi:lysophospholipase L1-like esterase
LRLNQLQEKEAEGSDRINIRTAVYADAAKAAAASAGVAYVDLFGTWMANGMELAKMAANEDGLHLSMEGNTMVYKEINNLVYSDERFHDVR